MNPITTYFMAVMNILQNAFSSCGKFGNHCTNFLHSLSLLFGNGQPAPTRC